METNTKQIDFDLFFFYKDYNLEFQIVHTSKIKPDEGYDRNIILDKVFAINIDANNVDYIKNYFNRINKSPSNNIRFDVFSINSYNKYTEAHIEDFKYNHWIHLFNINNGIFTVNEFHDNFSISQLIKRLNYINKNISETNIKVYFGFECYINFLKKK